jgi:CelD/BcsL family acetyltransferase involved in cellulose biosynthesis
MNEALKTIVVTEESQLKALAADWDNLIVDSRAFSPMLSYAWISSFLNRRVRTNNHWACICAYRGDQLCGVLPLVFASTKRFGLEYEVASSPHDSTTPNSDIIVADGEDPAIIRHLIDTVFEKFPRVQILRISGVTDLSNALRILPTRHPHELKTIGEGCYVPVPSDFDAFRASLSKNFRSNLNKARNHARRAGTVTFDLDSSSANRAAFLDEFMEIEAANWKGDSGSAIKMSSELVSWYTTLVNRLEETGLLEWQTMRIDDDYAAANLCIRSPRKVFLWKLGYKESYSKCSPGNLLLEHVISTESERGELESLELLTSYSWYEKWNMQARSLKSLSLFRRGPKGRLLHAASRIREWLKSRRKTDDERPLRHSGPPG